jgi:hypothetical protein
LSLLLDSSFALGKIKFSSLYELESEMLIGFSASPGMIEGTDEFARDEEGKVFQLTSVLKSSVSDIRESRLFDGNEVPF